MKREHAYLTMLSILLYFSMSGCKKNTATTYEPKIFIDGKPYNQGEWIKNYEGDSVRYWINSQTITHL